MTKRVTNSTPKPRAKIGRPSLLTAEVERELFINRELGLNWRRCSALAGISYETVMNWREIGKKALVKSANKRTAHEQKCLSFLHRCERVDQEWLRRCETVLTLAMTPGQNNQAWREASVEEKRIAADVAKWKLSHQAPDEYSTQTRTELTGKDGGAVELAMSADDVWKVLMDARALEEVDDG